jgi:glycosyltransferase involved in cell wall biosynthesis
MTLAEAVHAATTRADLRVASVPASHVYVRHLSSPDPLHDDPVTRLADPPPPGGARATGQDWWPPAMLDPEWIDRHHDAFDVMHVQFGFDALAPSRLGEVVDALRRHGKPLVHTVHDLRNPHHPTSALHDEQLDVLVPAADAVVTLTAGAAAEVERRWGSRALVLPHPHVVPLADVERLARRREAPAARIARDGGTFRVGLHVKSLRACMDPLSVLPVLVDAVRDLPGGVLQVDGHTDVLEPGGAHFEPELAGLLADTPPCVDVRVHDYFSDDDLVDYLAGLDLSVLPYRFGTHSGWLELCRDLGTPVAAPTCGFYAEQAPVHSFTLTEDAFDADGLVAAVHDAYTAVPVPAPTAAERLRQRQDLADAHAALYASLVTDACTLVEAGGR